MKRMLALAAGVCLVTLLFLAHRTVGLDSDPYAPLKLYDGSWEVKLSAPEPKTDHIENHCAQTGLFYACEQNVNGKTGALVVFLPTGRATNGAQEYRTQALLPDASPAGEWGHLVIDGDTWTYTWESGDSKSLVHWRNVNRFSGKEKIHFELQKSEDGTNWKTQMAGDEEHRR